MRRLIDFLGPLGLLLAAGAWAWQTQRTLPGGLGPYLAAGAALIVAHVLVRWEDLVRAVGGRQLAHGASMALLTLAFVGILGFANYLVYKHTKRWDLTKNQRYSLSDQAKRVLAGLDQDVTLLYFERRGDAMDQARARLRDYELASPHLKLEFIDPRADPLRARQLEITATPTLVLQRGERREKIGSDSEQEITNALVKLSRSGQKTVCFLEGEGERNPDDTGERGLSSAKSALEKSQYAVKKVLLLREGRVGPECAVLVLAAPQKDLLPETLEPLRAYVRGGGKLLAMAEPPAKDAPTPHLDGLLAEWSIAAGHDMVLDLSLQSQLAGTGPLTPLASQYPFHEITKDFTFATAFHTARSVEPAKDPKPGISAQSLAQTSPDSWAETALQEGQPAAFDPASDRRGPVSLGVAAVIDVPQEPAPASSPAPGASPVPAPSPTPEAPKREGRVVAYGDADFASNAFLAFPGNKDLFLNSVAWLAQDADLISIRPKEPDDQKLFLTAGQTQAFVAWALLGLPGLCIVAGIVSWWRRR